jgi:hypothetical protein
LPNGLRLLVKEDHRLPFVEFRAMFQGGVLAETSEDNGITSCQPDAAQGHAAPQRPGHRHGN